MHYCTSTALLILDHKFKRLQAILLHLFWCLVSWSCCGQVLAVVDWLWIVLWTMAKGSQSHSGSACGYCGQLKIGI